MKWLHQTYSYVAPKARDYIFKQLTRLRSSVRLNAYKTIYPTAWKYSRDLYNKEQEYSLLEHFLKRAPKRLLFL